MTVQIASKVKLTLGLLILLAATGAAAQSTTPITVGQTTCGRTAPPAFNCYSVPLTVGANSGTAWFFPQGSGGFIIFRPNLEGADYVEAAVTSSTVNSRNAIGQVTQATYTFVLNTPSLNGSSADPDSDGDADAVIGSITINFAYYYGGYGRNSGWIMKIVGGGGQQSIPQD